MATSKTASRRFMEKAGNSVMLGFMKRLSSKLLEVGGITGLVLLALLIPAVRIYSTDWWKTRMHKTTSRSARLIQDRANMLRRRVLMLAMEEVTDDELREIFASPLVTELDLLDLQDCKLTADSVKWLVQEPKLRHLRHLALSGNPLGDGGALALATAPLRFEIKELLLARIGLSAPGAVALSQGFQNGQLQYLDVGLQPLNEAAALALAVVPAGRLRLREVGLTADAGRKVLARASCRELDLQDNLLGRGALHGLLMLGSRLEIIDLTSTGIGPEDAMVLAGLRAEHLHTLVLSNCPLGDAGLRSLSQAPWLGQLKLLSVVGVGASKQAAHELHTAFGARDGLLL